MKYDQKTFVIGATMLALGTGLGSAATIVQTANNGDWNAASQWGGTAPTSGNDYEMALIPGGNGVIRASANGANSTFGGDSLTVVTGTVLLMKTQTSATNPEPNTATVNGPIIFDGGLLNLGPNAATNASLIATEFIIKPNGATMLSGFSGRNLTLEGPLTGVGDILIEGNGGTRVITFANLSGYTGNITVTQNMGIAFGISYTFTGSLNLSTAGSTLKVNSGQTLTFAPGKLVDLVNGEVPLGIYSGASLDALGANYTNNGGTLVVAEVGSGPRLTITPNSSNPGNYDFSWDSRSGKLYDLVSSTDLSTAVDTWAVYMDNADIPTSGGATTTLLNVPGEGSKRFFAVIEKDAPPPPPLLDVDFEASDGGFTIAKTAGTDWAYGTPNSTSPGGFVDAGNGATTGQGKCWGTNITNPGFYVDPTTDSCLQSSVIDLTEVTGAQLSFAQAIDLPATDAAVVRVYNADTNAEITGGAFPLTITDGNLSSADWEASGPHALPVGSRIRIEWCLSGTAGSTKDYMGWYVDDVVVAETFP